MCELFVRIGHVRKVLCGVTSGTSARDVIFALAQALNKVGSFVLYNSDDGRVLAPDDLVILHCGRREPALVLRCLELGEEERPDRFGSERTKKTVSSAARRLARFRSHRERRASLGSQLDVSLLLDTDGNQVTFQRTGLSVTEVKAGVRGEATSVTGDDCLKVETEVKVRSKLAAAVQQERSRLHRECGELCERIRVMDAQLCSTNSQIDSLRRRLEQVSARPSESQTQLSKSVLPPSISTTCVERQSCLKQRIATELAHNREVSKEKERVVETTSAEVHLLNRQSVSTPSSQVHVTEKFRLPSDQSAEYELVTFSERHLALCYQKPVHRFPHSRSFAFALDHLHFGLDLETERTSECLSYL